MDYYKLMNKWLWTIESDLKKQAIHELERDLKVKVFEFNKENLLMIIGRMREIQRRDKFRWITYAFYDDCHEIAKKRRLDEHGALETCLNYMNR